MFREIVSSNEGDYPFFRRSFVINVVVFWIFFAGVFTRSNFFIDFIWAVLAAPLFAGLSMPVLFGLRDPCSQSRPDETSDESLSESSPKGSDVRIWLEAVVVNMVLYTAMYIGVVLNLLDRIRALLLH